MPKKCNSCGANVSEDHSGKCPECGEEKGYQIIRTINESISVSDFVTAKKSAMRSALDDAYYKLNELSKQYKDNEQLQKNKKTLLSTSRQSSPQSNHGYITLTSK